MKTAIIFHSVCANTYLTAKAFHDAFEKKGQIVNLFRVADDDWKEQEDHNDLVKNVFREMHKLPIATPEDMLDSDLVLMGSPTYFGNVSAEMKTYMDSIALYWFSAKLAGKKIAAFTSAGNPEGGADLCLQAIHTFGKYMGMLSIPIPTNMIPGISTNAYGIIQYSQGAYADKPNDKLLSLIDRFSDVCITHSSI